MSRFFGGLSMQVINALSPTSLDDQQPLSISLWVLPVTTGPASGGRFIAKTTGGGGDAGWRVVWGTDAGTASTFLFRHGYVTTALTRESSQGSVTTTTLKWQHVAVTWDSTTNAGGVKFYVDGKETSYLDSLSSNGVGATTSDAAAAFLMGNREGAVMNRTFNGEQAHIQFHKRVLSVGEIGQIRMYPGSQNTDLIQGYWPLWSPGAGTTGTSSEHDYSGKGNVATATSCLFSNSSPPVNGMFVIPTPHFAGCA